MKLSAAVIIPILSLLSRAHAGVPVHSRENHSCNGCWMTIGTNGQWVYAAYRHFVDGQMPALQCLYKSKYDGDEKIGFACEYNRVRTGLPLNS